MSLGKYKVTLIKSVSKSLPRHKATILGLGLKRIRHSVLVNNEPCIVGMINQVRHLISVEEV
jgi:large subunit ribosomal protein L30